MQTYTALFYPTNTGYAAYVPDIEGVVATDDNLEKTIKLMHEALEFHIEGMIEDGDEIPDAGIAIAIPIDLDKIRASVGHASPDSGITIQQLQRLAKIYNLKAIAEKSGLVYNSLFHKVKRQTPLTLEESRAITRVIRHPDYQI